MTHTLVAFQMLMATLRKYDSHLCFSSAKELFLQENATKRYFREISIFFNCLNPQEHRQLPH